jgi:hypothetical protein
MIINIITAYLVIGLSINYGVSKLDKIQYYGEIEESDKPLNPNLVILFWPILFASFCYFFIRGFNNR